MPETLEDQIATDIQNGRIGNLILSEINEGDPDAAPWEQPEPDAGDYTAIENYAKLVLRQATAFFYIHGYYGYKGEKYDNGIHLEQQARDFKAVLFDWIQAPVTQIILDDVNGPEIYLPVRKNSRVVKADRPSIQVEPSTNHFQYLWHEALGELNPPCVSLDSLERRGAFSFVELNSRKRREHFETVWQNKICPALYPPNSSPQPPQP